MNSATDLTADQAVSLSAMRLTLYGPVALWGADGVEVAIANRRARALLAILALEPDRPILREQVSKLLWAGRFEAQARASLRQCLLDLGKLLEPLGSRSLAVTRDRIGVLAPFGQTDLADLERALAHGHHDDAIRFLAAIGSKPLIGDCTFGEAFAEWLDGKRQQVGQRLQVLVRAALADLDRHGDRAGHAALIDAFAVRDPFIRQLVAADRASGKIRIAVLPFAALGAEGAQDYFADGMADELITTLGQVPQLLVVGRTSSFHFRDSRLALPEVAAALGVSHVIEGTVQRHGNSARINVRLIDGETGFDVWGERYDGSLNAIFVLQERVAQAVTAALASALDLPLRSPLVRGMTPSKPAYDLFLQGRALSARLFGDGVLVTAIDLLEKALAIDPDFAEAWLALAEAHQLVAVYTPCRDRAAASARMADCAGRAIVLNPGLGYAYSLLGIHQWTLNNVVGALDLAMQGYALEPDNPAVVMRLGSFLLYIGRTSDAMRYVDAAIAQDPVDGRKFNLLAVGNFNLGRLQAARDAGQRLVDLGFPSMWLGVATAAAGHNALGVQQYQRTRELMNKVMFPPVGAAAMTPETMDAFWSMAAKGVCSGEADDRATYCQMLDFLHATLSDPSDPSIVLPAIFMGYADMAMKALSAAITPANMLCLSSVWADVEPIRRVWTDPEFIPFAQRMGMAAAWDKYGWPDLLPQPGNVAPGTVAPDTN